MTQNSTTDSTPEVLDLKEIAEIVAANLDFKKTKGSHGLFLQKTSSGSLKSVHLMGSILGLEETSGIIVIPEGEFDTRHPETPMLIRVESPAQKRITEVKATRGSSRGDIQARARIVRNTIIARSDA